MREGEKYLLTPSRRSGTVRHLPPSLPESVLLARPWRADSLELGNVAALVLVTQGWLRYFCRGRRLRAGTHPRDRLRPARRSRWGPARDPRVGLRSRNGDCRL